MTKREFIIALADIGSVKFGSFTLKSGKTSPFYLDLRTIVSYPAIMDGLAHLLADKVKTLPCDIITGIPYTALPMATLVSSILNKPLVYRRKEEKAYGTGASVLGAWKKGDRCLIIDDLITTGESKIESAEAYESDGLVVKDFVVVVDRSKNAGDILKNKGYQLHSLVTLDEIVATLLEAGRISQAQASEIRSYTEGLAAEDAGLDRVDAPGAKRLLETAKRKGSRLILSLDVDSSADFFRILEASAPHIAMVKTHADVYADFDADFIKRLTDLAAKHDVLIFEDRKFADIGNTVRLQYRGGLHRIADWAEYVTVHMVSGPGILPGLFEGTSGRYGFLLARMSSKDNLINETYTRKVLEYGKANPAWTAGYIGHGSSVDDLARFRAKIPAGQLLLMPGVQLTRGNDNLGQQYLSVEDAFAGGADFIIVGRGIYGDKEPEKAAALYRDRAAAACKA